jgi:hypothetical protein
MYAASAQAYRDYLFQFDNYRKTYDEFTVAKNEFKKFKSLSSESAAIEKTKLMLLQRNQLLRAYFLLLGEKLGENPGLISSTKNQYSLALGNEVGFLERNSATAVSIDSIENAQTVSRQLESHYDALRVVTHQTITTLTLGNLEALAHSYDQVTALAQNLITTKRESLSDTKRTLIDRWMLQIQSKRSLYQQKADLLSRKNDAFKGSDSYEIDRQSVEITKLSQEAKQFLAEGSSFLGELVTALKYEY